MTTARLPDLIVRTTSLGDRFGWRLVTIEGNRYLSSSEQAEKDGSPADYATRSEARQAAGKILIDLVNAQPTQTKGEIVTLPFGSPSTRLVA